MKSSVSPFQFHDHRQFLREAIKSKGFSYRSFALRHGDVISFGTLAGALTKGRSGTKTKPPRTLSLEMLARLGRVLRLSDLEIQHLILLRLENEAEVLPGPFGSAYTDAIRSLSAAHKKGNENSKTPANIQVSNYSELAHAFASLVDALPSTAKLKISREFASEAKAILARQRKKPGVKALAQSINRLEELMR